MELIIELLELLEEEKNNLIPQAQPGLGKWQSNLYLSFRRPFPKEHTVCGARETRNEKRETGNENSGLL